MNIPFTVYGKIAIDSFFLDKVTLPEDRIFLIVEACEKEESDGLQGLSENDVRKLIEEAYLSLNEERKRLDKRDVLRNLYNPASYMNSRHNEILRNSKVRIYKTILEKVLEFMNTNPPKRTWYKIEKEDDKIFVCGKYSSSYTILYQNDEKFRKEMSELLQIKKL